MNEKYFYNHACHRKKRFDDVGQLNYVERSDDEETLKKKRNEALYYDMLKM